ncbi:MAG TPA: hypothetical protein VFD43_05650, partial [Planctomycetota bacterium]|nr:hypothetical protein [Planctomycetota bacterium]
MSRGPPAAIVAAAALLVPACASRPPVAPPLSWALDHRAGSALGEAPAGEADVAAAAADPAAALALTVEWHWVPWDLHAGLQPIGSHALAVSGTGGDSTFGASPLVVGDVRVAFGEAAVLAAQRLRAPRAPTLAVQLDALPAGVTALHSAGPLVLELSRGEGQAVELAVTRQGRVPLGAVRASDAPEEQVAVGPADDREPGEVLARGASAVPVEWREVVLLDTPLAPGGAPAVVALPGGAPGAWLAAVIEVQLPPAEGEGLAAHAARLERCLADVAAATERQAQRAVALDAVEAKQRQLIAAARSMAEAGDRRRAAVFLASETGASLALDVVLAADEEALDSLAASWRESTGADVEQLARGDALAWSLERATALWLAGRADAGLPAELEAVLLRQTGVVARSPGLLRQFTEESGGLQSWCELLEQENRLALEDSLPGSRVRAFDWLAARGAAPEGYDPLAPRAERQAALLAAEEG